MWVMKKKDLNYNIDLSRPMTPVKDWKKQILGDNSSPTLETLRSWILNGTIDGCVIGGLYFVFTDVKLKKTGNRLVDQALSELGLA